MKHDNKIESIMAEAVAHAKSTTSTRCAYMATAECRACTKSKRGECDFRARRDSYAKAMKKAYVSLSCINIEDSIEP